MSGVPSGGDRLAAWKFDWDVICRSLALSNSNLGWGKSLDRCEETHRALVEIAKAARYFVHHVSGEFPEWFEGGEEEWHEFDAIVTALARLDSGAPLRGPEAAE